MNRIHWSQIQTQTFMIAIHPDMLNDNGCEIPVKCRLKGESRISTETVFYLVNFDRDYVTAYLDKKLLTNYRQNDDLLPLIINLVELFRPRSIFIDVLTDLLLSLEVDISRDKDNNSISFYIDIQYRMYEINCYSNLPINSRGIDITPMTLTTPNNETRVIDSDLIWYWLGLVLVKY